MRRRTAAVGERVEGKRNVLVRVGIARGRVPLPRCVQADQRAGHRDLVDAVLRERDADGVADAVVEQRADTDGALDAPVLTVACLGDAEMYRVIPVGSFLGKTVDQQAVGGDHHLRIARLHR